jgi:hypothetical protein
MAIDPQRQRVIEALATALRTNIAGGDYHFPLADSRQVSVDPTTNLLTWSGYALPMHVIEPTPDAVREFYPAMQIRDEFDLNVTSRMDIADVADPAARMQTWERLHSDIERALAVDITLGGLVYDVRVLPPRPFVGIGSAIVIVASPVKVSYHRAYGEP